MTHPTQLSDFHQLHSGQTCLLAAVGPNLNLTPPEQFNYPSFGINTIYEYEGWKPDYYVWVDRGTADVGRRWRDLGERFGDVAKFVPSPEFDGEGAENVYRFKHRPGFDLFIGGQLPNAKESMTRFGIGYRRILDATLQLAWWMGFTTILLIGVQHKPGTRREHFWGRADYDPSDSFLWEERGLSECARAMQNVTILNLSEDTYLPENVIPRDDWKKWRNHESKDA